VKAAARNPLDAERIRIRLLLAVMLLGFCLLGAALWRIQVAHGHDYQQDLYKQSVRRVRLPGMRGRIYDRQGRCIADNRPSYGIAVYLEELRRPGGWNTTIDHVQKVIQRLSQVLGVPPEVTREDIATHVRKRLPLPLLAWRDVDRQVLARFAERAATVPGVDIYVEALRTYPYGDSASHALGYVGRAELEQDPENPYHYYLPEMAGKAGVERKFDGVLRGEAGGRLVRVDVSGFRHEDLGTREPRAGSDVQLSLDMRVQRLAEEALGQTPGSIVVMDPRNGDVLALANYPRFDSNSFVPAISSERWNRFLQDERKPLLNRAVAGAYAPGSIFKPVVAMAALANHLANANTRFECPGYLDLGDTRFRCWTRGSHGPLQMREAIQRSCNVYFFKLGLQTGHQAIYHMASALGLGRPTGISLEHETEGLLPSDAWMRRQLGHGWRRGDTCNLAIGQGALLVTPLQMAMVTSALANEGKVYRPRLVTGIRERGGEERFRSIPPQVVQEMNWAYRHRRVVREGMRDVVMTRQGTGKLAHVEGVAMAGKTGTAEYGRKEEGKKRGWMIAFAPFEAPRYAIAVVVEDAITGGVTAAPRVKQLVGDLFDVSTEEGQG